MSDDAMSIIEFSESVSDQEQPELLPKQQYRAQIVGAVGKISGAGNKYASVSFHISPEEFPADYPAENYPDGIKLTHNRVMLEDNPRARWMLKQWCETIGAPPPTTQLDLNDWMHLDALITVGHDSYEGVEREQIDRVDSI